ncbi:MAG: hypothetical protein DBX44_01160 [Oscillospiraceae bacterium]|nr:MAG: hypothetical protein DBX44_01160 [Oscillospiraceae bacterium]
MIRPGLLVSLLFPPRCPVCGTVIPPKAGLCEDCRLSLSRELKPLPLCPHCGKPKPACVCQLLPAKGIDGCLSAFIYREPTRRLFERFKQGDEPIARQLAAMMLSRWREGSFPTPDAVIGVPPRPEKFDHVRLLSLPISRALNIDLLDGLIFRQQNSRVQHTLSARERWENARISYALRPGSTAPKRILLIDDIMTTGATLSSCAHLLREAGADEIYGLTAATTLSPDSAPSPNP